MPKGYKKIHGVAALLAALAALPPAHASNKVSSPDITGGRIELEDRGGYDFDGNPGRDGDQLHKFVANYAPLDFYRTEIKGVLADDGSGYNWTYIEWSHRFQLIKNDDWLPKLSLQGNYKFSLRPNQSDKFESTILMQKDTGPFTHVTNINFENDIGGWARPGTNFNFGWKSKYNHSKHVEPGAELYMDFGRFGASTSGPRRYQFGPAVYGKIMDEMKYELGFLFGLTQAAPTGRLKWILTYSF
ncbi:MAG: hypothetical protein AB7H77_02735 [Bdellovibrionales bacterium]